MRWPLSEYVLKGIYLGLLLFVAIEGPPDWQTTGQVAAFTLGGLVLALAVAAGIKRRQGYRVQRRVAAFVLFVILESPTIIYGGIVLGMACGAIYLPTTKDEAGQTWLAATVGGGTTLGMIFWLLRQVDQRWFRLGLSLALAVGLVGCTLYFYHFREFLQDPVLKTAFGVRLLLGIPLFYLLTFAGRAEESEVEIAAVCAALGLGLSMLMPYNPAPQSIAFLVPLGVYFVYTTRILPGLRVFKHVLRGISYANVGQYRPALQSFRRALELDPKNTLARESMWKMHRAMNLSELVEDPETLRLVDVDLCIERATSLLLLPGPSADRLEEANRLLDLVLTQKPGMAPVARYWRAVACTHARNYDQAATELAQVLDHAGAGDPYRESVLLPAWQLALTLHPELNRRVGTPQLEVPGRRLDAIGAVERHLANNPEDASAWEIKRLLYSNLTEADYKASTGGDRAAADFDHGYAQQMGLALLNDAGRWQRGVEFLRMAARGLLDQAPSIFMVIAQAHERAGQKEAAEPYYELAKRAGQAVGPKNLGDESRQAYFQAVKLLAEKARARQDWDAAIDNYHLYAASERSGLETLRILAEMYESRRDVLGALRVTEQALIYNTKDKDLLERKDKYYYSVTPEDLQARLESIRTGFDVAYCLTKAKTLLDHKDADLDLLDWAEHLATLAQIIRPESLLAKMLRARALRRRGELEQSQALLEDVFNNRPEKFATAEDEDAWYLSSRLLGEMYLFELGKPDLAIACFNAYRKSSKSGADTMFKLGQAYEQIGDRVRAAKCYKHVTSFDRHPLAPDANDALQRLGAS